MTVTDSVYLDFANIIFGKRKALMFTKFIFLENLRNSQLESESYEHTGENVLPFFGVIKCDFFVTTCWVLGYIVL